MGRCSVLGCRNDTENKLSDLSFHSFPEDENLRRQWTEATGRRNWSAKNFSRICSRHFKPNDLIRKKKMTVLMPNAVPQMKNPGIDDDIVDMPTMSVQKHIKPDMETATSSVQPSFNFDEPIKLTSETRGKSKNAEKNVQLKDPDVFGCKKCDENIKDGRVYRCVQCPDMLLCAECETDDRHQEHCVMRFPSRRIYDKVKQIFESLQEEIGEILTIKDEGINPETYDDDDEASDDVEMKPSLSAEGPPSDIDPSSAVSRYISSWTNNIYADSTKSAETSHQEAADTQPETDCDELTAKVKTEIEHDPLDLPHSSQTDNRARKRKSPQPPQTKRQTDRLNEITVKEELEEEEEVHFDESFDAEIKMEPPDGEAETSDQAQFTMYGSHKVHPEDT